MLPYGDGKAVHLAVVGADTLSARGRAMLAPTNDFLNSLTFPPGEPLLDAFQSTAPILRWFSSGCQLIFRYLYT